MSPLNPDLGKNILYFGLKILSHVPCIIIQK